MSLVQEQQRLTAAQQEILSLKDNLVNHSSQVCTDLDLIHLTFLVILFFLPSLAA
jgi:hypothetical protein